MYVPILKWKQGEYLALERLEDSVKNHVIPLIEIPPIGWDFEQGCLAKTINQHLEKFADRFHKKWKDRSAFIDLALLNPAERMSDHAHPMTFIFDGIREQNESAIPVTGISRTSDYQNATKGVVETDSEGLCVRLTFDNIVKNDIETTLNALIAYHQIDYNNLDIILDLESPNFHPIDQFSNALHAALRRLPLLPHCRSFTIAATAFPKTMGQMKLGGQVIERSEWLLYQQFQPKALDSGIKIQFGDYAIAHPSLPQQDMRLLKPAASLRYTIEGGWYIGKGTNVKDNGFGQYAGMCKSLVDSGYFNGPNFSKSDLHILECSENRASTGNLPFWRWIGTNHHITKVVHDLANFHAT